MQVPIVSDWPANGDRSSISSVPERILMPVPPANPPESFTVPPPSPALLTWSGRFGSVVTIPLTASVAFDSARRATAPE